MSQRESGYARKERDLYETPEWVTSALRPHVTRVHSVWEPAAGGGKMVNVMEDWGLDRLHWSDISEGVDFLECNDARECEAIITNPPYELAEQFIVRALRLARGNAGLVAMAADGF